MNRVVVITNHGMQIIDGSEIYCRARYVTLPNAEYVSAYLYLNGVLRNKKDGTQVFERPITF